MAQLRYPTHPRKVSLSSSDRETAAAGSGGGVNTQVECLLAANEALATLRGARSWWPV
eukprot:CAMPEP_0171776024 /NCGR_PEP_ID=MMETSP0991-20121206/56885_1 /TAXON_ID=483369 /ORGANISM="non described non described, Strain CCMP2098" /LENGTH=57 /DNA_ID=CAMNT_0012382359 /DNA_START=378 /DNA_END=551 /DNA_ORIENTATION=+